MNHVSIDNSITSTPATTVDAEHIGQPCTEVTSPEQNSQLTIKLAKSAKTKTKAIKATDTDTGGQEEAPSDTKTVTGSKGGDRRYRDDGKPMLSDKGSYPARRFEPLQYWDWIARGDMRVSAWLTDWESSLGRAGWIVIRKLPTPDTEELPYEEMDPAHPEEADLYCPKRGIYLTLLPAKIPFSGAAMDCLFKAIKVGYPGSLVIIHARNAKKHFIEVMEDGTALDLLSKKNTLHCIELGALVEFQGVLYEPTEPPNGNGECEWKPTANETALEVYHEYRSHSVFYHEDAVGEETRSRLRQRLIEATSAIHAR